MIIISFPTTEKVQLINITDKINSAVAHSNVEEGVCLVFVPHATAGLLINEDEEGFKEDIKTLLAKWIPEGEWQHNLVDNNATSHLASSLIGQSKSIPISNGRLALGNWQQIFLVELDGPRQSRKVIISVLKEEDKNANS